jgi:hypothetical protein
MAASNVRLWYTSSIPTGTGRSIISRAAGSRGREFRREDRRRSRRGQPVGAPEKSLQMAGGANRSRPIPEAGPGLVQRFHDCRIEPLSVQSEFREITRARGNIRPHPPNKRTRWRPTTRPSLEPGSRLTAGATLSGMQVAVLERGLVAMEPAAWRRPDRRQPCELIIGFGKRCLHLPRASTVPPSQMLGKAFATSA